MLHKVKAYTRACSTCQRVRPVRYRLQGSMKPLPQRRSPWMDISMDLIVGLPESCRKRHAKPYNASLVVVNWYTKQARFFLCHNLLHGIGLAEIIARKLVVQGASVPQSIVSDRGPQLTSKFWAAFCYHLQINPRLSTAYHPQTDRQTERQNQTLEQYLRAYVNYLQNDWVYWLLLAEFAYNNSVHASMGIIPFYAEKGFHPSIEATI